MSLPTYVLDGVLRNGEGGMGHLEKRIAEVKKKTIKFIAVFERGSLF